MANRNRRAKQLIENDLFDETLDNVMNNNIQPKDTLLILFTAAIIQMIIMMVVLFINLGITFVGVILGALTYYLFYLFNYLWLGLFIGTRILWQFHRKEKDIKFVDQADIFLFVIIYIYNLIRWIVEIKAVGLI